MAGDWIKIESSLPDKPEVMQLAQTLAIDEMQVVGHLVRFWCWCDRNMSLDCPVVFGTKQGLDRVAMRDGFVDAMVDVGWLTIHDDGRIEIPNYDHHLSQSAKTRAKEQKKKASQRKVSRKCPDVSGTKQGTTLGPNQGPEKRREEKSNKDICVNGYSKEFEQFWEVYPKPRKRDKADAWKAWKVVIASGVDSSMVIAMAERYAQSDLGSGAYSKMPAVWLRKGSYLDDQETWREAQPANPEPVSVNDPSTWHLADDGWWRDRDGVRRKREPKK